MWVEGLRTDSQAAGLATAPVSPQGALQFLQRRKARFWCTNHERLAEVTLVHDIKHAPKHSLLDVALSCECSRLVTLNTRN